MTAASAVSQAVTKCVAHLCCRQSSRPCPRRRKQRSTAGKLASWGVATAAAAKQLRSVFLLGAGVGYPTLPHTLHGRGDGLGALRKQAAPCA